MSLLMQHAGGREVIDIEKMRRDRVISRLLGWIPSDSALGDWDKRYGVEPADSISSGKVERTIQDGYLLVAKRTIGDMINEGKMGRDITLDVDATVIYADKKGAKYTYKGDKGFTPMLAFLDEVP